ncbi:MAG TPA: hypothetical protein VNK05_09155, partial [Chloroflexota bacterium]|nr:hypothetical protein [Chloroflexota bacterium]
MPPGRPPPASRRPGAPQALSRYALVLLTALLGLAAPVPRPAPEPGPPPARARPGFVARDGAGFVLDGAPFRFVGVNLYNAAGDPRIYACGSTTADPDADLDAWFARLRAETGARVLRFWAFQSYTAGGTDWRGLDRVFRLATANGLKVIPVLENQLPDCTRGGPRLDTWYATGFRQPDGGYPLSYAEYVRRVVARYRDEPAVMAWMLMNEAESRTAAGAAHPEPLYAFAREVGAAVKRLDPDHLVTLGVIGSGQAGVAGTSYARLHALPSIDFAEY